MRLKSIPLIAPPCRDAMQRSENAYIKRIILQNLISAVKRCHEMSCSPENSATILPRHHAQISNFHVPHVGQGLFATWILVFSLSFDRDGWWVVGGGWWVVVAAAAAVVVAVMSFCSSSSCCCCCCCCRCCCCREMHACMQGQVVAAMFSLILLSHTSS